MPNIYRRLLHIILITLFIGFVLLLVIMPYRPTRDEAVNEVLALDRLKWFQNGQAYSSANTDIVFVTSQVRQSQLVVAAYDNLENQTVTNRCIAARYVTRHLFSGPRSYSAPSICWSPFMTPNTADIVITEHFERGTYVLMGMSANKNIAYVQASWTDGSHETIPLHNDSFAFFRPDLDSSVKWVVGLDENEQIIPHTMALNEPSTITLFDYERFRQVTINDGIVVMGTYFSKSVAPRQCLQLTYLTLENAEQYLIGEEAFTGQGICIAKDGSEVLPAVTTFIDGNTIVGGLVLDNSIVEVQLDWVDGMRQVVPVVDGFFFAERAGTSVSAFTATGLTSP